MTIRTLVFDFGNVLAHFSHRRAAEQLAAYSPFPVTEVQSVLCDPDLEDEYDSGRLSTADVLAHLRRRLELEATDEEVGLAVADMFTRNEPVCALVPALCRDYRLALLSNTNDLHYRHFRRQFADVLDRFHYLFPSHEVGLRKPDCRLFRHVEQATTSAGAECLFIDDLAANVEAARSCGWQGVLYRPDDDLARALAALGVVARP